MVDMQKKTLEAPRVDGFKVFARMKGTLRDVDAKLRTVSFMEVVAERDCVSAAYVESRDIEKNPYTFTLFKFRSDSIEVLYTIPPGAAPKKRKLDMVRYFLNVLTALGSTYSVENSMVYQLLDAALREINDFVSLDYNKLYASCDAMKKDYEDMLRRLKRTQTELDALKRQNYELKMKNDELAVRLNKLEAMSDDTLKEKLEEWLAEHNGEINVTEFSRMYRVPEARAEEMLDALVRDGYVQPAR